MKLNQKQLRRLIAEVMLPPSGTDMPMRAQSEAALSDPNITEAITNLVDAMIIAVEEITGEGDHELADIMQVEFHNAITDAVASVIGTTIS